MAFTIRELSSTAEANLKDLMKEERDLKTKTKAINFVLSEYYTSKKYRENLNIKNNELEEKYYKCYNELNELKNSLKNILKLKRIQIVKLKNMSSMT